jgi:DDE superfamily endonuclease
VAGSKVILIWDHLPVHRNKRKKHYLLSQRNWLTIEWLPGYAPDLNPTEEVWNNVKGREMANLCPDRMEEPTARRRRGIQRIAHTRQLPFSFMRHADLFFDSIITVLCETQESATAGRAPEVRDGGGWNFPPANASGLASSPRPTPNAHRPHRLRRPRRFFDELSNWCGVQ